IFHLPPIVKTLNIDSPSFSRPHGSDGCVIDNSLEFSTDNQILVGGVVPSLRIVQASLISSRDRCVWKSWTVIRNKHAGEDCRRVPAMNLVLTRYGTRRHVPPVGGNVDHLLSFGNPVFAFKARRGSIQGVTRGNDFTGKDFNGKILNKSYGSSRSLDRRDIQDH
ncbi:hypothetical protein V2J09_012785, partial [Rumex salicifolius]